MYIQLTVFLNQETAEQMMKTTVPSEHQALGRKAKGFNRAVWDQREWWQRLSRWSWWTLC
jgi:predicted NAD-dependent protein-ADP-ribosyltransferase YbiA (DUF1768 family)